MNRFTRNICLGKPYTFSLIILMIFSGSVSAQTTNPYSYQDLSHLFYEKQKDSIRKTWICPLVYKEKATQKLYKDLWDDRVGFIYDAIVDKDFVHEKEVYNYVDQI